MVTKKLLSGVLFVVILVILLFFVIPPSVVVTVDAEDSAAVEYSFGDTDVQHMNAPFRLESRGAPWEGRFRAEGGALEVQAVVRRAWLPVSRVRGRGSDIRLFVTRSRVALRATS